MLPLLEPPPAKLSNYKASLQELKELSLSQQDYVTGMKRSVDLSLRLMFKPAILALSGEGQTLTTKVTASSGVQ